MEIRSKVLRSFSFEITHSLDFKIDNMICHLRLHLVVQGGSSQRLISRHNLNTPRVPKNTLPPTCIRENQLAYSKFTSWQSSSHDARFVE
jgi:hypothetical protein